MCSTASIADPMMCAYNLLPSGPYSPSQQWRKLREDPMTKHVDKLNGISGASSRHPTSISPYKNIKLARNTRAELTESLTTPLVKMLI